MDLIIELVKLASVGVISSFFTYYLAFRRHRHKKWWELKVSAYKDTIEALSDLLHYFDVYFEAETGGIELSEDKRVQLQTIRNEGYSKIRKSAHSGAFLFSNRAEQALKELLKVMDRQSGHYIEDLDNRYGAVRKCLEMLVDCSKRDLKLKTSFLE